MTEPTEDAKAAIEKIESVTKKGFDPKERLHGRGLRKASITLFLDEDNTDALGDVRPVYQNGLLVGFDRSGILGEIDRVKNDRAIAEREWNAKQDDIQHDFEVSRAKIETLAGKDDKLPSDEEWEAQRPEREKFDGSQFEIELAELEDERDRLVKELAKTALEFKLRAVPPIIKKDQRRKAKLYMKKQPKVDPEDDEFETDEERKQARNEQFERIHLGYLLSVVTTQVTDNATGDENHSLSFEDALEHIDWLPEGQLARLDAKVADLLFTDAISRQIELQEDFS